MLQKYATSILTYTRDVYLTNKIKTTQYNNPV